MTETTNNSLGRLSRGPGTAISFAIALLVALALALITMAGPAGAGTCHGCPDDGGGSGTNAAPTISVSATSYNVNEGGSVTLSGAYNDADGDTVTVTVDANNDGTYESEAVGDGASSGTWSYTFSAAGRDGPASQTVNIKASDSVAFNTTPTTVNVVNAAPSATFNAPNSASAGGEFAVSLTSPSDPSGADIAAGLTYAFDCQGDGTFEQSGTATTATCTAGAPGTQTVKGKISDKDNGSSTYTHTVTLTDGNEPTGSVVINGGAAYTKSVTVGLTLSASDADQYAGAGVASMRFSHDGQVWSDWHPYATTWSWTLLSGDGTKSVHVQYKDNAGNVSAIAQDTIKLDTTVPKVSGTTPTNKATGVARNVPLTATFSEKMKKSTLTTSTFKLFKITSTGTTQVTDVTVALSSDGLKATLDPFGASSTLLEMNTKYKAIVTTGAKDLAGNKLDQNSTRTGSQPKVWTFTTGSS